MVQNAMPASSSGESYPGERLGLPRTGRGSMAPWQTRVIALVVDWAACMVVAVAFFGPGAVTGDGWRAWMTLALFFLESTLLTVVAAGSLGQLLTKIAVVRLDREPLGLLRGACRAVMVCLVLPFLVVGADRRGLHDVAVGTVVVSRR